MHVLALVNAVGCMQCVVSSTGECEDMLEISLTNTVRTMMLFLMHGSATVYERKFTKFKVHMYTYSILTVSSFFCSSAHERNNLFEILIYFIIHFTIDVGHKCT